MPPIPTRVGVYIDGYLAGTPAEGVGNHWWRKLRRDDYFRHQLPDPAGTFTKPIGW